jgi:hypothetical protein
MEVSPFTPSTSATTTLSASAAPLTANVGTVIGQALQDIIPLIRDLKNKRRGNKLIFQFILAQTTTVFGNFGPELKTVLGQHEFLVPMLAKILTNKVRPAKTVTKKLAELSADDGGNMGTSFAISLVANADTNSAVGEFIGRYPALKEFAAQHEFFTPMLQVVARRLLKEASWGTKLRLYLGAGLSISDMVSDINVIIFYLGAAETAGYGWALLCMVLLCIVFQIFVTLFQYSKASLGKKLQEVGIVLSCCKPGVDAARVAAGDEHEENAVLNPKTEMGKLLHMHLSR